MRQVSPYRTGPQNSRKLPHRTPKNWRRNLPSPVRQYVAQVLSPLWVGICNSAMTPNIEPRLEETSFTLPHRTPKPQKTTAPDPKQLAQGSAHPVRLWVAQVPSPLWVGICNSAMTPNIEPRLEETSFTLEHRTQKPQKTIAPVPKKLARGSSQPCQTMGSPGTLLLMGRDP